MSQLLNFSGNFKSGKCDNSHYFTRGLIASETTCNNLTKIFLLYTEKNILCEKNMLYERKFCCDDKIIWIKSI